MPHDRNVITVKTCMDSVGSECTQEIKDMWNGPTKQYSDRCADIGQFHNIIRSLCDIHIS